MAIKYLYHIKQLLTDLYIECNMAYYEIHFTKLPSRLSQRGDLIHSAISKVNSEIMFSCII